MYIDFSQLKRDVYGNIEQPSLILQKPHGSIMCYLKNAFHVHFDLKYSDVSSVSFDYPYNDGEILMPCYDDITKGKLIDVRPYGMFVVSGYEDTYDGVRQVKTVELKSREVELEDKHIVLGDGVYCLWNPAAQDETILHYIVQSAPGWSIGTVSSSLIGRYRTCSNVDSNVLDFLMNEVQKSFGCIIVFNSYTRTIDVIDVDTPVSTMPVYISYHNLLKQGVIKQLDNPVVTKLYVQGADGIDIRNVNPTGDNYIYNLDWYIQNNDIPANIAEKWRAWEHAIFSAQPAYEAMVASRNTQTAEKLTKESQLIDIKNNKLELENLRTVYLQMKVSYVDDSTSSGKETLEEINARLQEIEQEISDIDDDITDLETVISQITSNISAIGTNIAIVNSSLKMDNYFADDELAVLSCYFKEGSFQDSTFAVFDTDTNAKTSYAKTALLSVVMSDIDMIAVANDDDHFIGRIDQGSLYLNGSDFGTLTASIVSGTIEFVNGDDKSSFTGSYYLSSVCLNDEYYGSGSVTISGVTASSNSLLSQLTIGTISESSSDGSEIRSINKYAGSCTLYVTSSDIYVTQSVSEYQKYSVQKELYNYAQSYLKDASLPTCEFEIDSANIIASESFDVFRNSLTFGHSCYLQIRDGVYLKPVLIGASFNADNANDFKLVMSNSFRRHEDVENLRDVIRDVSVASRAFDSNKYSYEDSKVSSYWVKQLLANGYQAALAQISAGKDNLVTIDSAGIKVASNSHTDVIQLNNGMIALVDKSTTPATVKMAMGRFKNSADSTGQSDYVGIMAEVIAGTLIAGQTLVIECETTDGIMQFKVDHNGVLVNNGRWYMVAENGCIAMDPKYGIVAGKAGLFTQVNNGNAMISGIGSDGKLEVNGKGQPVNENIKVWIGMDGQAYFDGIVKANGGEFNGDVYANNFYFKNGDDVKTLLNEAGEMDLSELTRLDLGGIVIDGDTGDINFNTDGSITFPSGSISWDAVKDTDEIDKAIEDAQGAAEDAQDAANTAMSTARKIANGTYNGGTFIDGTSITAPEIYGGEIYGGRIYASDEEDIYAYMSGNAFALKRDGSSNDRMIIEGVENSAGECIQMRLILGEGSDKNSSTKGRLYLQKGVAGTGTNKENRAGIYYTTADGETVGFTFLDDGSIEAHASEVKGLYLTFS